MEKIVSELKRLLKLKDQTDEGDVVVIAALDPRFLAFAVAGPIERDESRRDEWWNVTLHILGMPVQTVVWKLREPQFSGQEIFTMGGNPHFIKALDFTHKKEAPPVTTTAAGGTQIIQFSQAARPRE